MAEHIVVGIDGSSGARDALDWALLHCQPDDTVEVIHTWNRPATNPTAPPPIDPMILERGADAVLQREMDELRKRHPQLPALVARAVCGHPGAVLLRAAQHADLLVIGTRGRGGFVGLLLGSTSTYLAHHAPCPVVIVPAHDTNS